jgi:hypothetical protein
MRHIFVTLQKTGSVFTNQLRSKVSVVTGYRFDWFDFRQGMEISISKRESGHSSQSSAKVRNVWSYNSTPPFRIHCMVLNLRARENVRAVLKHG